MLTIRDPLPGGYGSFSRFTEPDDLLRSRQLPQAAIRLARPFERNA